MTEHEYIKREVEEELKSERLFHDIEDYMRNSYRVHNKEVKLVKIEETELNGKFLLDISKVLKKYISPRSEDVALATFNIIKTVLESYGFRWKGVFKKD